MSLLQALVLGLTQGLTEFLPISSSGHLVLVPWVFGWTTILDDAAVKKTFDVALHMGTLVAVVVYFRRDLVRLAQAIFRRDDPERRLAWAVVVATIPAGVAGALFESFFEKASQPWVIAITLAAFGIVMALADRRRGRRHLDDIGLGDGILVGLAQAAALIPGVSRSGVTISAGVALGQARETAARFSFLLSVPVIAGAGAYKGMDLVRDGFPPAIGPSAFSLGIVTSAISGFMAIAALIRFLQRRSLTVFVVYRFLGAVAVFLLIASNFRDATVS